MKMNFINGEDANNNGLDMGLKFLYNAITALDFVSDSVKSDDRYKEVVENLSRCNTVIDSLKQDNNEKRSAAAVTINTCLYN